MVPLLQDAGHRAIPVDLPADNPAAGLAEYAQLVTEAADGSSNLTLVAQSLGGFTAPLAAMKTDVRALVFVNAMIPLPGETPGEWWDATGWEEARRAAAERGGYPTEFDLDTYFLHDVPPEVAPRASRTSGQNAIPSSHRSATSATGPTSRSRSRPELTTGSSRRASSRR